MLKQVKFWIITGLLAIMTPAASYGQAKAPEMINFGEVIKAIEYPVECRKQGIEGKIVVSLQVSKEGQLKYYEFLSFPCEELRNAVEGALPELKFSPATNAEGEPIDGMLSFYVDFEICL
jgi:outer membrane biosynthesis protein TonB